MHTVNITVGTPLQHFNVSVDFESNTFFIPSADCKGSECEYERLYYGNQSHTYEPNGTKASASYWSVTYDGFLSQDTIRIGDLEVENQVFEEYTESYWRSIAGLQWGFDGVLGLAPPWTHPSHSPGYPSYLPLLQERDMLEENVFSIKYPHKWGNQGEITFGGSNPDLYTGAFRNVSFLSDDDMPPRWKGHWNIKIDSMTFNTSIPLHQPAPNWTATLTSDPILILPKDFAINITTIIGAKPMNMLWYYIPCDRRPYLPELTVEISGENYTIDAFDYTFELHTPYDELVCPLWIDDSEQYGVEGGAVVLGTAFLKRFYSRWNLDTREIGCKS